MPTRLLSSDLLVHCAGTLHMLVALLADDCHTEQQNRLTG